MGLAHYICNMIVPFHKIKSNLVMKDLQCCVLLHPDNGCTEYDVQTEHVNGKHQAEFVEVPVETSYDNA